MLTTGDVFAGYTIERLLGRGGMGSVYLARHPRLPRLTAMKLLNREMFADQEIRARFEREADLVARLDHTAIVPVYDRGVEDEQLWISMRYVDGVDAASLDVATLAPARAVRIVAETAGALDYAHGKGVLHRDVKPANIMIERAETGGADERVFLTDFGIARLRDDTGHLTRTGTFTATLAYASPEQLSGAPLDHRSDQYSLACTLFRLLSGTVPFEASNPVAVIHGHMNDAPPPISRLRPGLPVALDAVLGRALAKNPADRFADCAGFAAAAGDALAGIASGPSWGIAAAPGYAPHTPPPGYGPAGYGAGGSPKSGPGSAGYGTGGISGAGPGSAGYGTGGTPLAARGAAGHGPALTPGPAFGGTPGMGFDGTPGAVRGSAGYGTGGTPIAGYGTGGVSSASHASGPNGQPGYGPGGNPAGAGWAPNPGSAKGTRPEHGNAPRRGRGMAGAAIGAALATALVAGVAFVVLDRGGDGPAAAPPVSQTAAPTATEQPEDVADTTTTRRLTTTTEPVSEEAAMVDGLAALHAAFPRMVPDAAADDVVFTDPGWNGATCFGKDRAHGSGLDATGPDFGDWVAVWYCFGGPNKANYEFYAYRTPEDAAAAVAALPPGTESSDANAGRNYGNIVLDDFASLRPRMVTTFADDPERSAFLMHSIGFIATREEFLNWWATAPLR